MQKETAQFESGGVGGVQSVALGIQEYESRAQRRILEVYLNVVASGRGIYGAESVCRYYDGTAARSIDREQAARLAAILPAPLKRRPDRMNRYSALILERIRQMDWSSRVTSYQCSAYDFSRGSALSQYPSRLLTMFFSGSPFSNLSYCFRKKRIA